MPDNSKVDFGFQFLSVKTGRPIRSERKKIEAMRRFFKSEGLDNDVDNVHVVARWRNPDDKAVRSRQWKTTDDPGQDLADFHGTLGQVLGRVEAKVELEYARLESASPNPKRKKAKKPTRGRRHIPKVAKRRKGKRGTR